MPVSAISGKTRVCGVIGDPIEHSMSPVMHNAAFKKLGIDGVYVAFRVKKAALAEAVAGIRALGIRGLNVTIPHKVAIIPLLHRIDPLAERIGAVNTVVNDDGVLTGFNTDASGFLQALLEKGVEPQGKNVVVLGAGGAARAICFSLAERGANLVILNRREETASQIARLLNNAKTLALTERSLAAALDRADILVNATSVGMSPNGNETLVPTRLLRPGLTVFDAVYNPVQTRLLKEAEATGARTISGLDMLVWQGALAFEKFTRQKAPVALMKREALKSLMATHPPTPFPEGKGE